MLYTDRERRIKYQEYWWESDINFYGKFGISKDELERTCTFWDYIGWCKKYITINEIALNSKRDDLIRYYLSIKRYLCNGEKKSLTIEESSIFDTAFLALQRKKNAYQPKYLARKEKLYYEYDAFAGSARVVLDYKYVTVPINATAKIHNIEWLSDTTCRSKDSKPEFASKFAFDLEDYWFYEQCTCINICIEASAHLDKIFQEHNELNVVEEDILSVLANCIEKNYNYIADIENIDWKIQCIKAAISAILDVYCNAISQNTSAVERSKDYLVNILRNIKQGNSSVEDRTFLKEVFKYETEKRFHQVIEAMLERTYSIGIEKILNTRESVKESKKKSVVALEEDIERFGITMAKRSWKQAKADTKLSDEELLEKIGKDYIERIYPLLNGQSGVTIFCDIKNEFVVPYVDAARNLGLSKKSSKRFRCIHTALMNAVRVIAD